MPARRQFLKIASILSCGIIPKLDLSAEIGQESGSDLEEARIIAREAHERLSHIPNSKMYGAEQIGMLAYPGMTLFDFIGPQFFFASMMGATVHVLTTEKSLTPIGGDTGLAILPTTTTDNCPEALDLLFVPGGTSGTLKAMNDRNLIRFVAEYGAKAKFVSSVCTGALLLGKAGLLRGRSATTHWAVHHLLEDCGATRVQKRIVKDGKLITGAGISAGVDLGLFILSLFRGESYAKTVQLQAEYDPQPPFSFGSPSSAPREFVEPVHDLYAPLIFSMRKSLMKSSIE